MSNRNVFFLLLVSSVALFAQELPEANTSKEVPYGFYKASIRYGEDKNDSMHIRWSHTAKADTFWVYSNGSSLEYITNTHTRTVFHRQPIRYERRMAIHHLREFIFNSPLRFSDMESLSKKRDPQFLGKSLNEYFIH